MRIAFLCKRRYTGKDVIFDRYGRLYEFPRQLALRGYDVRCYCVDYHGRGRGKWMHNASPGTLIWNSWPLGPPWVPAMMSYPWHLLKLLRKFNPDLIFGASDIPNVVLTQWLAGKLKRPYVVDLYDNFESFGQARIPFFNTLLAHAVRKASLVLTVSEPLRRKVQRDYAPLGNVEVFPNAINKDDFIHCDRTAAREELGLPVNAKLIGTAGGLSRMKGLATLYTAWPLIESSLPNAHLVLAGPIDPSFPPPLGPRVHYLGTLPSQTVATLYNALDIGVVTLLDDAFGCFCFPQKAYEMMACGLPLVSANVGVMADLLHGTPSSLYRHDAPDDLLRAVLEQIQHPTPQQLQISDWQEIVANLDVTILAPPHQ